MPKKFHINPKTGNPNQCGAKYHCPFGSAKNHYDSKDEARVAYEKIMQKKEREEAHRKAPTPVKPQKDPNGKTALPPINLPPLGIAQPDYFYYGGDLLEATDVEPLGYYGEEYTSFTEVDPARALEIAVSTPRENWPDSLNEVFDEHEEEWGNHANWDVEFGYYEGETPVVSAPASFREELQKWWLDQPNACDADGVLEHVRGKGYETQGLTPIEAVKKLLREENGLSLKWVDATKRVIKGTVAFDQIRINQGHYAAVDPRKPEPAIKGAQAIDGVLHWSSKEGYRLLDGYHRLKANKATDKLEGNYLVIH